MATHGSQMLGGYAQDALAKAGQMMPQAQKLTQAEAAQLLGPDMNCIPQASNVQYRTEVLVIEIPINIILTCRRQVAETRPEVTEYFRVQMPQQTFQKSPCQPPVQPAPACPVNACAARLHAGAAIGPACATGACANAASLAGPAYGGYGGNHWK